MKKIRMIDCLNSLWIILSITFLVIIFQECRKVDKPANDQSLKQIEEKFLSLPASSSPELQRIVNKIKEQNDKSHFIPEFVKKNGYPVWQKVLWNNSSSQNRSANRGSNTSNDTLLFFIPLQQSAGTAINSYITCLSPDSNTYRFSYYNKMVIESLQSVDSTRKHFLESVLSIFGYLNKQINNKDTLYVAGVFKEAIFNVTINFGNTQTGGRSLRPSDDNWIGIEICWAQWANRSAINAPDCYDTWYDCWSQEYLSGPGCGEWWIQNGIGCGACGGGSTSSGPTVIYYAGVPIIYETNNQILKFNSVADVNTVLDQLEADYNNYNENYDSQYPNATAEELDVLDEQNGFDDRQTYKNFEALFNGFSSKRSEIESVENAWLENNFSGTNPDVIDLTFEDGENTIFNNNYSFKIGNDIYQYTSEGWYINGVYQDEGGENRLLSNCKTNKRWVTPQPQNLQGTNRYVVVKVAIHSILITHSIKSKTVHFKTKNGKMKRARTQLQVRVDGIILNTVCSDPHNEYRNDPFTIGTFKKRKELRARKSDIGGPIWRTFQGDVVGTFWTGDGFTAYYPLTW